MQRIVVLVPGAGCRAMFVRVKKIGAYEYLYLVENAREGGRHVQRVIKALGRRDEVEASGLIDGLIASAARHSRRSIVLSSFYRGELSELHRLSIGPDLARISHSPWVCRGEGKGFALSESGGVGSTDYVCRRA